VRSSKPRRGLRNLSTRASRRATVSLSGPELYLKLTSLEIERSRLTSEQDALLERIKKISERIHSVEKEQEALNRQIAGERQLGQPILAKRLQHPSPNGLTY
jgi:predicted  nucleic acid-binding Zn-ribbon protein